MITQDRLKQLLNYNQQTGWFTNLVQRNYNAPIGARAGNPTRNGKYREIQLDGLRYYEHHLAWFYVHGVWVNELDHKDTDGTYNAIDNLRECSHTENMCNTQQQTGESGLRGAYLDKRRLTWYSKIQFGRQIKFLGRFDTAEEAHQAFEAAARLLHGEFYLPPSTTSEEQILWL